MCVNASLGQDGFYRTGVWVEHPLTSSPPLISNEPFCARVVREVSWLWEWEICGLSKVRSSRSVVLLFSSWSFSPYRMNLQLLYHGLGKGGDINLSASRQQDGWELTLSQRPQSQSWRSVWAAISWFPCTSPLQQDSTDLFPWQLGSKSDSIEAQMLIKLMLASDLLMSHQSTQAHGHSRVYVEEYHIGVILRHTTLWG